MGTLALILAAFFVFNAWESINMAAYMECERDEERERREIVRVAISVVLALVCVIAGGMTLADVEKQAETPPAEVK